MIVLPLDPAFSLDSSTSPSEAAAAAAGDMEAGPGSIAGDSSSNQNADDDNDLSQPLLAAAAAAPAGDSALVHSEVATASGEVHGHQLPRQVSPDMLMHVGDDVSHGQRDVAESPFGAPVLKEAAAATVTAGPHDNVTGVCIFVITPLCRFIYPHGVTCGIDAAPAPGSDHKI
jgi:hypothetical protein